MSTRRITEVALLSALAVVSREALMGLPNVKPVTAIFLVATFYWGFSDGAMVMLVTMTLSALNLGFGPVVLLQVGSYALVLGIFSLLTRLVRSPVPQTILAALMALLYGLLISLLSSQLFGIGFFAYYLNGVWFDLAHAASTALFYLPIYHIFERFKL